MSEYGITDNGFVLKRLENILLELQTGLQEIFPDANINGESVFGQLLGIFSGANSQDWESFQLVANQFNPSNARSANLDSLVQLNGIIRLPAKPSTITINCTGTTGVIIPAGSLLTNSLRTVFYATDSDAVFVGGVVDIPATATKTGAIASLSGTVTTIVNPLDGWTTATNDVDAVVGRDIETDKELRIRRDNSTLAPSQSVVESIYSNLSDTEGVDFARVYVNETDVTDSRGIPSHSIAPVVVGGDQTEIAEVIFNRKSAGILSFGNTLVNVTDVQGFSYPVSFIRPSEIDVYLIVNITSFDNFPVDGQQQIIDAILAYANGGADEVGAADFGNQDGFPPGQEVVFSRLFTPLNSIPGHQVDSLFIDITSAPTSTANIPIQFDQVSKWDSSRITVNVT